MWAVSLHTVLEQPDCSQYDMFIIINIVMIVLLILILIIVWYGVVCQRYEDERVYGMGCQQTL